MTTADELRGIIRAPLEETKLGGYDIPSPKKLHQKVVPRKRHEIDEEWVKGIRKWWKGVTTKTKKYRGRPKTNYSKVGTWDELAKIADDASAVLRSFKGEVEKLQRDLYMVKGFWSPQAFAPGDSPAELRKLKKENPELHSLAVQVAKEKKEKAKPVVKVVEELSGALELVDDKLSQIKAYKNYSHPEGIYSPGGDPLWRVFDDPKEYSSMVRNIVAQVDEAVDGVDKAISGRLLRFLSSMIKEKGDVGGRVSPSDIVSPYPGREPVEDVVSIGRGVLVFKDIPFDPREKKVSVTTKWSAGDVPRASLSVGVEGLGLDPRARLGMVKQLQKAQALLQKKGLGHVWYGEFIKVPSGSYAKLFGTKGKTGGRAAASYNRSADVVNIYDGSFDVQGIIHELGHRYWYKFLTRTERAQFSKHFGKVKAPSAYGSTDDVEEFAELFAVYVSGKHGRGYAPLDREQKSRFANFLGRKKKLESIMTTVDELRGIIRAPLEETSAAMAMAMSMFDKQQSQADAEVGKEMTKLAKRYVGILQAITGKKDGWTVSPTKHLLSIDNEDAGIAIDIHWETDLASGKVDMTIELNKRSGPEGPRAKWQSKIHLIKDIMPSSMNLSPAAVLGDAKVRRFLKEHAEELLAPLLEEDGWTEREGAPMKRHELHEYERYTDRWGNRWDDEGHGPRQPKTGPALPTSDVDFLKDFAKKIGSRNAKVMENRAGQTVTMQGKVKDFDVWAQLFYGKFYWSISYKFVTQASGEDAATPDKVKRAIADIKRVVAKGVKAAKTEGTMGVAEGLRALIERKGIVEAKMDPFATKVHKEFMGLVRSLPKVLQRASEGGIPWKLYGKVEDWYGGDGLLVAAYFQSDVRAARAKGTVTSPSGYPFISVSQWGPGDDEFNVQVGLNFEESGTTTFIDENVPTDKAIRFLKMAPRKFSDWLAKNNFTYTMPESKQSASTVEDLRALIEYKGTPYGKQGGSREADMWGSKHGEKKHVGAKDKATGKSKRSGHSTTAKKMARKGERQAAKKEIMARLKGESMGLAEGKRPVFILMNHNGVVLAKPLTDAKKLSNELLKYEMQTGNKTTIEVVLPGENPSPDVARQLAKHGWAVEHQDDDTGVSLDDLGLYFELMAEDFESLSVEPTDLDEAAVMAGSMAGQMAALAKVQDTAQQLGRFATEFAGMLKQGMKKGQVDVRRLGEFGRRVDAAHSILQREYRALVSG